MTGDNTQLWQDLLSLLIGGILTAGIEFLRRLQAKYQSTGRHSADKDEGASQ